MSGPLDVAEFVIDCVVAGSTIALGVVTVRVALQSKRIAASADKFVRDAEAQRQKDSLRRERVQFADVLTVAVRQTAELWSTGAPVESAWGASATGALQAVKGASDAVSNIAGQVMRHAQLHMYELMPEPRTDVTDPELVKNVGHAAAELIMGSIDLFRDTPELWEARWRADLGRLILAQADASNLAPPTQ